MCTIAHLSPEEGIRTMKLKLYAIAGSHMGAGNWTLQEQLVLLVSLSNTNSQIFMLTCFAKMKVQRGSWMSRMKKYKLWYSK